MKHATAPAALALLAACTVGPDYQRPPAPVPASYKQDGWKAAEPKDAVNRGEWWAV
jgi:outer membrane protein TolC